MKKILKISVIVFMASLMLVSCGGDKNENKDDNFKNTQSIQSVENNDDYIGIYEYSKIEFEEEIPEDELEIYERIGSSMSIELCEGGKLVTVDDGVSFDGEWEIDGEKLIMTMDGDEVELKIKDGKIYFDAYDGVNIIYEKK